MKIQILGTGCTKCKTLYTNVKEILENIDKDIKLEYNTDVQKIVELGIIHTPVLVINDEIINFSHKFTHDEIEKLIKQKLNI